MDYQTALKEWRADQPFMEAKGIILPGVQSYLPEEYASNFGLAMDAQPTLTTDPNNGVPSYLTMFMDPKIFKILFAPVKAAIIIGENRKGSWLDETATFPVVEHTGEVSSYGDYAENGSTGANTNFPQRQAYLFQTIKQYGERELERAGLARLNWVNEIDVAAATILTRFANLSYFFGVRNLQNYGLLNDPNLSGYLTPATKAAGGTAWIVNGKVNATANEVYADIEAIWIQLVGQTAGLVDRETKVCLAMSPTSALALTAVTTFNVNVYDMLKKNFPNIRFEVAVQYGAQSSSNPQGVVGGNVVQLIADNVEGQETAYCAFNEKMRAHKIIPMLSSFKQKVTGGTWGAIIRFPAGIAQMQGV